MTPRLRSRWTRVAALLAVAVPVLTLVGTPPAHAAPPERFTQLGTWVPSYLPPGQSFDGAAGSTQVIFDEARRTMWVNVALGQMASVLAAYDADTLQPLTKPVSISAAVRSLTLDPATGGVIVVESTGTPTGFAFQVPEIPRIEEYTRSGDTPSLAWTANLTPLGAQVEVAALTLDPSGKAAYIASQTAGLVGSAVTISRLDLSAATPALQWSTHLPPACPEMPSTEKFPNDAPATMAIPADAHALYFMCGVPDEATLVRPQITGGIGKLTLGADRTTAPSLSAFSLFPIAGTFHESLGSAFDAATGRLIAVEGNQGASSVIVFDTTADRYLAQIDGGVNLFSGMGFDPVAGRIYMMESNPDDGLLVSDERTTPPTQPTTWPEWYFQAPGVPMIPVDGATSRVLLLRDPDPAHNVHAAFRVLRDNQPPIAFAGAVDPDSGTKDIAEAPGVTGASFTASAQGYGMVLRQVGGPVAAAQDIEQFFILSGDSNPELRGAYLNAITLSTDEATASSIPADRDQNYTGAQQATVCGSTPAQLQDTTCPWPYTPAQCSSFDTLARQSTAGPAGDATSTCSAAAHSATTTAQDTGADAGGVTVGALSTTAMVIEDSVAGAHVEVTSEARDVSIAGGALRIARVAATATAHAHGHRGSAGSTYTRTVEGVVLNGTPLCTENCDLDVISSQVETAFPGKLRIVFPSPDPGFAAGSPGGYQALVRDTLADHLDDMLLSAQAADRIEVPGMEVVSMLDTRRSSRTVLRIAGVEAEAHYGIYPLDQFSADQSAGLVPGPPPPSLLDAVTSSTALAAVTPIAAGAPGGRTTTSPAAAPLSALPALFGWHGWQWALTHPAELLRLAGLWLVLLTPVYASARRWSLLRRHQLEVDLT